MSKKSILISVIACLVWGPLGLTQKADASPKPISINQTQIDQNFIHLMEGSRLYGYVPLANQSSSGVTIAHGVDLGQYSLREFNNLPIEWSLKRKLQPYVGLKKYTAQAYLNKHPLRITPAELQAINKASADSILMRLVNRYEKESGNSFLALPAEAQTVLFSYAYQYGPGFMYRSQSHSLWEAFISQNWSKASTILREAPMYKSRRISEARLLEQLR